MHKYADIKTLKICIHQFEYTTYEDVLYQKIAEKGVNIWYVTYKSKKPYWKNPLPVKSCTFSRKILTDGIEIPFLKGSEKFSLSFVKMLLREKFTIVVLPLGSLVTLLYLMIARLVGSITVCYLTIHKLPETFIGLLRSIIIHISLLLSNYAITLTEIHKKLLLEMGFSKKRIFVIPHGVDTKLFSPNTYNDQLKQKLGLNSKRIILYVGRLTEEKGLHYLLKAMEIVSKRMRNTSLLIVGEGSLKEPIQRYVHEHKLNDFIKIVEPVGALNIPEFFSICDIHVAPSITTKRFVEPFGMVYLEAMASGKPSIAFDIPAPVRELIVDSKTGYLVKEKDVKMLAERICELLMDDEKRVKMGKEARKRVLENYDIKKIARDWATVLKRISQTNLEQSNISNIFNVN